MFDDRSREFKNQFVNLDAIDLNLYEPFTGQKYLDALRRLASPLERKVWANVNSTCVGGGVAEMLQGIIPFARALGIDCRWFVIEGSPDFFKVTKKFHNLLQGVHQPITLEEIFRAYLETLSENTRQNKIIGDYITVHDPQPAAMIMNGILYGQTIWRCHIETSQADLPVWRFLLPYINQYRGCVFTAKEFIRENLQIPAYEICPSIDPLRPKNKEWSKTEALEVLSGLFHQNNIDPERPILAAISRYDVHKNQKGIIRAFRLMKEKYTFLEKPPLLILVGNSASDDPEGSAMFDFIREEAGGDPDIHLFVNVENNDAVVGSLMAIAQGFVHISTKEGFGLVVSEAMWQKCPVIGSRVGGIQKQIRDGYNGYLVEPNDYETIAEKMRALIDDPTLRHQLGKNAKEFVRQNFILPVMMQKELTLMRYYLDIDNTLPDFRCNSLSYREITSALYARSRWPFSIDEVRKSLKG